MVQNAGVVYVEKSTYLRSRQIREFCIYFSDSIFSRCNNTRGPFSGENNIQLDTMFSANCQYNLLHFFMRSLNDDVRVKSGVDRFQGVFSTS